MKAPSTHKPKSQNSSRERQPVSADGAEGRVCSLRPELDAESSSPPEKYLLGPAGRYKIATHQGTQEIEARPFDCRGATLLLHKSTFFNILVATHGRCGYQVWRNGNEIETADDCVREVRKQIAGDRFLQMQKIAATKPVLNDVP